MGLPSQSWICCQIGAREHYAVARALHGRDSLAALVTEAWVPPNSIVARFRPRLAQRFHPDLAGASVHAFTSWTMLHEWWLRLFCRENWPRNMRRNAWFQRRALVKLKNIQRGLTSDTTVTLFAYSYAAVSLFEFARSRGWATVLGQIDPGHPGTPLPPWAEAQPPSPYWEQWREECRLADAIVVNSQWSFDRLVTQGVPASKMHVIPLALDRRQDKQPDRKSYPGVFTEARPLRVLFLGRLSRRKGMDEIFEAIRLLGSAPISWHFVGDREEAVPEDMQRHPRIVWESGIPRDEVAVRYRDADVFLFPSHSDGFGLTQLEAQAWKLPVIASTNCGAVVRSGVNGLLLKQVTARALTEAVQHCLAHPADLQAWSDASHVREEFSLDSAASRLLDLGASLPSRAPTPAANPPLPV